MKFKLNIGLVVLAALTMWGGVAKAEAIFYQEGKGYIGILDIYGDNAANDTRFLTSITQQQHQMFQENLQGRINAAMHNQAPDSPGVFALGNGSGMNAGGHGSKVGVWAQYNFSHIRDTGYVSNFRGNDHSGTFGVDYLFTPCFLAGLAFTYSHMSDGEYSIRNGRLTQDTYMAAIYAALIAHKYISFDAMLGYGKAHREFKEDIVEQIRPDGTLVLIENGPRIEGSTYARRFLGSIFANARYAVEMLNLWLRFGYMHTHENQDGYSISTGDAFTNQGIVTQGHHQDRPGKTVNIGNLSGRLRAGYKVHEMVEPFVQGGINYNVVRTKINADIGPAPSDKRFGWMVGGGFRFFEFLDSTTGGIQYNFHKRGDLKVHNVTVDLRHDF